MRRLAALSLAAGMLLAAGCGDETQSGGLAAKRAGANVALGQQVFNENCAGCHGLAAAGAQGQTGPNLDQAFGYAREQGFDESTIFEVTLEQMRIPAPPMPDFDEPGSDNELSEDELVNVAAYVARCAGTNIAGTPVPECQAQAAEAPAEDAPPEEIFTASGCGGCHVLAAAGTTGTVGPNLDESETTLEEAIAQIANGGGGMPAYKDRLSEQQIEALARYVVEGGPNE